MVSEFFSDQKNGCLGLSEMVNHNPKAIRSKNSLENQIALELFQNSSIIPLPSASLTKSRLEKFRNKKENTT